MSAKPWQRKVSRRSRTRAGQAPPLPFCGPAHKVRYAAQSNALAALELIRNNRSKYAAKKPIRAYECPHCLGWHLTSAKAYA